MRIKVRTLPCYGLLNKSQSSPYLYRFRLNESHRRQSRGIPKPHNLGFCFIAPAFRDLLSSGLTVAPQTITASPAAKMFFPALMSLSMPVVLQLGQSQREHTQWQLIHYKTAMVTSFRTREKAVDLNQFSPVPITLIFKLTEKLAPSSIADSTGNRAVFNARARLEVASSDACPLCGLLSYRQILNSYQAIRANQLRCQLVQKIGTGIFDLGVYSSYFKSRLVSVTRA